MKKCKGENCSATDGVSHSRECFAEHEKTVSHAGLDTAGNRHPEARYRGYKGEPLNAEATPDEAAAWREGDKARFTPNVEVMGRPLLGDPA